MQSATQKLVDLLKAKQSAVAEQIVGDILANAGPEYKEVERDDLAKSVGATLSAWIRSLESGDFAPLITYSGQISQRRAASRIELNEVLYGVQSVRAHLWELMDEVFAEGEWDRSLVKQVETGLHESTRAVTNAYNNVMLEAQSMLAEREQALAYQGRLIQELSSPIVPIYEGVLVLPLTGAVDSRRATQIMEAALEQIVSNQADVLILDITGVPVVDTGVANYLIQMARAVNLLGAQVVLVGIGAEIAQTIVQLGVELRNIVTRSNLQAGIEYALEQRGYAIQQI